MLRAVAVRVATCATVNCTRAGWWCIRRLRTILKMRADRLSAVAYVKHALTALRPDAEETAALRRALAEVSRRNKQPRLVRVVRGVAWLLAIALVGWIPLVLFR